MPERLMEYLIQERCPADVIESEGNYTRQARREWSERCKRYCDKYGYDHDVGCRNCWMDWLKEMSQ